MQLSTHPRSLQRSCFQTAELRGAIIMLAALPACLTTTAPPLDLGYTIINDIIIPCKWIIMIKGKTRKHLHQ